MFVCLMTRKYLEKAATRKYGRIKSQKQGRDCVQAESNLEKTGLLYFYRVVIESRRVRVRNHE